MCGAPQAQRGPKGRKAPRSEHDAQEFAAKRRRKRVVVRSLTIRAQQTLDR
jgi:hypothetical protein